MMIPMPAQLHRRAFLLALAAAAALQAASPAYLTYVGNFGTAVPAFRFDTGTGKLTPLNVAADTPSPSWVTIHPNGKFLYAVNENANSISAFSINPTSGALTPINKVPTQGKGPCHASIDHTGKSIYIANYGSGSLESFPLKADGSIGDRASFIQNVGGNGMAKSRQAAPHAHSANISPDNRFLVLADLGLDKLFVFKIDPATAKLTPNDPPFATVPAGSGPRHFVYAPNQHFAYNINEMGNTIIAFTYDAAKGTLSQIQSVSTLPDDFKGQNTTAEIAISEDGKFLYGSNRGQGSIAVYAIDHATGKLTKVENAATGGTTIRSFGIDPTGKFLLAGVQDMNQIVVFRRDKATGKLTLTGEKAATPTPVCIQFVANPR